MQKPVYRAYSPLYFLRCILFRLLFLSLAVYLAIFHFNENPALITIVIILCLLFFSATGYEEIIINDERIIKSYNSTISWLFRSKEEHIIRNISKAFLPEKKKPAIGNPGDGIIAGVVGLLSIPASLSQEQQVIKTRTNSFHLRLKSGEILTIYTELGESKIQEIVHIINSIVNNP